MRDGLMLNLAVLSKELRTRMRGRRSAVIITLYLLLLATTGALMLQVQQQNLQSNFNAAAAANTGATLFTLLAFLQLALLVFIVPGLTGAAIAGERDRQTLDLLLSTQVSSLGIILGKLVSSLSYILLLLVAALPVFSLAFLFGGVSPQQIGIAFLISLATALTLGSIGIALSTWLRRGQMATVATYACTFALIAGTLGITVFFGFLGQPSSLNDIYFPLVFNPFAALADSLPNLDPFNNIGLFSGLAFWHVHLIADAAIILVCTWLSVLALRPGSGRALRPRGRLRQRPSGQAPGAPAEQATLEAQA